MNTTSTVEKTWYEQLWEDYSYYKTALLLLYILFGTAANSVVLVVYGKDKKLTGRVFILCLAVIDIIACLFILPQTPMFVIHAEFESLHTFRIIYGLESVILIQSYLFAQVAMALDQFIAVYFPFKHRTVGPKLKKIMLVAAVSTVLGLSVDPLLSIATNLDNFPVLYFLHTLVYRLVMILSFFALLSVYPMIVLKLYRQHRKTGPKGIKVVSTTRRDTEQRATTERLPTRDLQVPDEARHRPADAETALTAPGEAGKNVLPTAESGMSTTGAAKPTSRRDKVPAKTTRKMHVQAIKVYSSIFLLFTLSLVSLVLVMRTNILAFAYVYSINHIGNPIIYYVFVPKFRETVNTYCKNLKCW